MAFSAVLAVNLKSGKTSWFPVGHQTYFHFLSDRKLIYVCDRPSLGSPVAVFDLAGRARGRAKGWDMLMSPSGQFTEFLQEDGAVFWYVYDHTSRRKLLAFNCDEPECRIGERSEGHQWNPKFDDQIVALTTEGVYGSDGTCDVYQVTPPRLVKRLPCGGLPVVDWSRDGRELITIKYEGGEYQQILVNMSKPGAPGTQ